MESPHPLDLTHALQVPLPPLGSEQRLSVLRTLVRAGPDGLSIGASRHAHRRVTGSTLTHHMKILATAGLVTQARQRPVDHLRRCGL